MPTVGEGGLLSVFVVSEVTLRSPQLCQFWAHGEAEAAGRSYLTQGKQEEDCEEERHPTSLQSCAPFP